MFRVRGASLKGEGTFHSTYLTSEERKRRDYGTGKHQRHRGLSDEDWVGYLAMLISATGMGLVPLFSRWATRTDMFDGTMGLNAGDSIGALMACGRMGMGVLFFVILMVATHKVKTFKELKLTPAIALGGLMACYVTSTLLTTVANAVLFIYTGPVICVLAARIFRKEPMSGLQWICLLVVFIGMLFGEGLLGFGVGTVQSCGLAMAVRVTSDARLSVANATFYMLLDVGVGIGPILLGIVAPLIGYANLYLCMAVVGALALALFLVVAKTEKGAR